MWSDSQLNIKGRGGIPFTENGERDILHREAKIFILGILYLSCILDIQLDMMNRTLALYV